jgi:DNA-binding transcriptional ArsR family regulator
LTGKCALAYAVRVGDVFRALADPTRRVILDELADRDGQTLFEICSRLVMKHQVSSTRQAVSIGVNGVPAFLLDRRLLVLGAQPFEVFRSAFAQLAA